MSLEKREGGAEDGAEDNLEANLRIIEGVC
jgi:hypothetical protein